MVLGDTRTLDPVELRAAIDAGELPRVVEQLTLDRSWPELKSVFSFMARTVGLGDVLVAAEALESTLSGIAESKRARAVTADAIAAVRATAAEALLARVGAEPTTERELKSARLAAELLRSAGECRRAARVFERLGDGAAAASLWGEMGELEAMESALAADEARRDARRYARDMFERAVVLHESGQRIAATAMARTVPEGSLEASAARALACKLDEQLVRGSAVSLRLADGRVARLAGLPALLGRDATAGIPLRDPGVSRRHAVVTSADGTVFVEDAGSRGGTRLEGLPIGGRVPLHGEGQLQLGTTVSLGFRECGPQLVELRGQTGLDRGLHALLGAGAVPLTLLEPTLEGVIVELAAGSVRLSFDPGTKARIAGCLVGPGSELLHGDVLELAQAGAAVSRIEVL